MDELQIQSQKLVELCKSNARLCDIELQIKRIKLELDRKLLAANRSAS